MRGGRLGDGKRRFLTSLVATPAAPPDDFFFASQAENSGSGIEGKEGEGNLFPGLEGSMQQGQDIMDDKALGEEGKIEITESAAARLKGVVESEKNPNLGLRVTVESGGCHGYQYKMELTETVREDDFVFSNGPAKVLVDRLSFSLLKGSKVDYATELIGSSFRVTDNPQAKAGGGCGCGISWEPK